jgi:alkylated DNA repair protein (DNA oxidative demethylase)
MHAPSFTFTLPGGFRYLPDWLTSEEEADLLTHVRNLSFSDVRMHGVVAKRRVVHFGWDYGYESWRIMPTEPIPEWLLPLRERAAALIAAPSLLLEEVLVSRYVPGAAIGWHRDAPMFGPTVIGVSLLGSCRLRFQRGIGAQRETAGALLAPRSAYVLAQEARFAWQHSIPPTKDWRYSITFRTVNDQTGRATAGPSTTRDAPK